MPTANTLRGQIEDNTADRLPVIIIRSFRRIVTPEIHLHGGPVRVVSDDVTVVGADLPVDGSRCRSGSHVTSKTDVALAEFDVDRVADNLWTVYADIQTNKQMQRLDCR